MSSRRDFIKQSALLSGATAMSGFFLPPIQRALAINPEKGSTFMDAEHIVILMQENRSFDHAFGKLKGVRGFNDPRAIRLPNKNKVWLQTNKKGETYAPFRLDIKNTKATWMDGLPHSWEDMVDARNGGKYDNWLEAKKSDTAKYSHMPLTMGFYDREDLPFYYALADAFTVCDHNFCSCLTGTTANRHYLWTGALRDTNYRKSKANVHNSDITYDRWANWKTFPERLEENDISWRVYQNEISMPTGMTREERSWLANFTNNNLEWFEQYGVRYSEGYQNHLSKEIEIVPSKIKKAEQELVDLAKNSEEYQKRVEALDELREQLTKARENKKRWNRDRFDQLSEFEKSIHNRAFQTNIADPDYHSIDRIQYDDQGEKREMAVPKSDVLHQFRTDVENGTLPDVSWVCAPENFSDHPSRPFYGPWYISEMMNILVDNPEVWKKTIFIINYDENDGYYDHMPPFVPPETGNLASGQISHNLDTWEEFVRKEDELKRRKDNPSKARFGPVGLGFRVPALVISPWSRGGYVNSDVVDQTSTIQLIEKVMAKKAKHTLWEENISSWRRMVCGDFSSAFRPYHGEEVKFPDAVEYNKFMSTIHQAQFRDLPDGYKDLTPAEQKQINEDPDKSSYMPKQEPGIKDSNALCYHMNVDGHLNKKSDAFQLNLEARNFIFGDRSRGVPYIVYAGGMHKKMESKDFETGRTWNFAVAPGDRLQHSFPLNEFKENGYHLRIHGPNGFYREYQGDNQDPDLGITCDYEQDGRDPAQLTGNLKINFDNKTGRNQKVRIMDQAYGQAAVELIVEPGKQTTVLDLSHSHHWYDLIVTLEDFNSFAQHFAGRVETGKDGKTDPQIGE